MLPISQFANRADLHLESSSTPNVIVVCCSIDDWCFFYGRKDRAGHEETYVSDNVSHTISRLHRGQLDVHMSTCLLFHY